MRYEGDHSSAKSSQTGMLSLFILCLSLIILSTIPAEQDTGPPLFYINLRNARGHVRYPSMNPLPPALNSPVPSLGEGVDEFVDRFIQLVLASRKCT
ncbi:hypothetical protein BDW22DRAFT_1350185 [Trametopsis cervina]|nr:hypothetical protein BDW22DRAFT_1350185 [Trametopsis cervina]